MIRKYIHIDDPWWIFPTSSILGFEEEQNQPCFCWQLCFCWRLSPHWCSPWCESSSWSILVWWNEPFMVPAPNKKEAAQNFHQVVLLKDVGILIYGLFTPTFELFSSISCQIFLRWFWGKYTRLTLSNQIILPVNSSSKNDWEVREIWFCHS